MCGVFSDRVGSGAALGGVAGPAPSQPFERSSQGLSPALVLGMLTRGLEATLPLEGRGWGWGSIVDHRTILLTRPLLTLMLWHDGYA